MKQLLCLFLTAILLASAAPAEMRVAALPGQSPLITFRVVFTTGAAYDPPDKPGLAHLTASMLARGGTRQQTYQQILDAMFPMATSISVQVDKEMVAFSGTTHAENLEEYYKLFRAAVLEPGWREDDLKRVKDDTINYLRVTLRDNNEEELAKEVLYNTIYEGHPYGHHNAGTVSSIEKITMADLRKFYAENFTRANLILGIAGGYPQGFLERVKKDFERLPEGSRTSKKLPAPKSPDKSRVLLIEKETRGVAYSIGYPIDVKRGDPDFPALLVAQSWFGQHRNSGGRLFNRMREARGLNYGNYAYIEYFPRGMFQFTPDPNLARQQQIFQIWIRPLEPPTAHFGLRLAMFELNALTQDGLTQEQFEHTREYLTKNANLLMSTKNAELGYAIDSTYYGIPEYAGYLKNALAKLTVEDVNKAIRKHLRPDRVQIVAVTKDAAALKAKLVAGEASPMNYNSPKPDEILKEDKVVEKWDLKVPADRIEIIPVEKVFE
ncbi:MAG: pitrilysin family protein [Bryobacteraceae bacterium]